ncbi:MAG: FoF1 ATP synthase subunit gamma [Bacillota bacterium]|nr:FoF1 ATP synthase subunit gamma [Bacillota bacterium]
MREIRRRLNSVSTTVAITRAMKTVASIKLQKIRPSIVPARQYYQAYEEAWLDAGDEARAEALRTSAGPGGAGAWPHAVFVLFSSDRGLAGSYNADVARMALDAAAAPGDAGLVVLGRKGRDAALARGLRPLKSLPWPDRPDASLARHIGRMLVDAGRFSGAQSFLVYTRFHSAFHLQAVVVPCVPPGRPEKVRRSDVLDESTLRESRTAARPEQRALWEPSAGEVAEALLPHLVASHVYLAMTESRASELAARVSAMDSASTKAEDLLEELERRYNRLRRERITRELVEASGREG